MENKYKAYKKYYNYQTLSQNYFDKVNNEFKILQNLSENSGPKNTINKFDTQISKLEMAIQELEQNIERLNKIAPSVKIKDSKKFAITLFKQPSKIYKNITDNKAIVIYNKNQCKKNMIKVQNIVKEIENTMEIIHASLASMNKEDLPSKSRIHAANKITSLNINIQNQDKKLKISGIGSV